MDARLWADVRPVLSKTVPLNARKRGRNREVEAPASRAVTTLFVEHVADVCYIRAALVLAAWTVVNGPWSKKQDDDEEPDNLRHRTGDSIGAH